MTRIIAMGAMAALTAILPATQLEAASLRGSPASMQQQNGVAQEHGLDFFRTADDIHAAVERGDLVELTGNDDYAVADFVSFPFARPELLLFTERLSAQYRDACGEKLVLTSATRPTSGQPANSHSLSVHPAGMALDFRVSQNAACRSWLEAAFLGMESRGLINGIREFHPPHYHVAVFPRQYAEYAAERMAEEAAAKRAKARRYVSTLPLLAITEPSPEVADPGRPARLVLASMPAPLRLTAAFAGRLFRSAATKA